MMMMMILLSLPLSFKYSTFYEDWTHNSTYVANFFVTRLSLERTIVGLNSEFPVSYIGCKDPSLQ